MTHTLSVKYIIIILLLSCNGNNINHNNENYTEYVTNKIGSNYWMVENLKTFYYKNGDKIPYVQDPVEWTNLKSGAWCYAFNDTSYADKCGILYNWYAINDAREIAPEGYHIATDIEWDSLIVTICRAQHNDSCESEDTRAFCNLLRYGFIKPLYYGYRNEAGIYEKGHSLILWWYKSSYEYNSLQNPVMGAEGDENPGDIYENTMGLFNKNCGFYIRCVKN